MTKKPHADTGLAKYIERRVLELKSKKSQLQIASEAGFPNPNMVTMIKTGTSKLALDRVPSMARALDVIPPSCCAWVTLAEPYDDGGISGGTLERPGLKRLMQDIEAGLVDQIVVYKIDRLTRSLADFARLVERLDAANASFVSVTQSFNTATSMGRLTLNVLLSFAQFEREVTAERIRDKIAASKKKGMWMGGLVPLGYDADGRTLKINEAEAPTVRELYALYQKQRTIRGVKDAADTQGLRSKRRQTAAGMIKGGTPFDRGHIYQILTNPVYAGRIRHRKRVYEGLHQAIIAPAVADGSSLFDLFSFDWTLLRLGDDVDFGDGLIEEARKRGVALKVVDVSEPATAQAVLKVSLNNQQFLPENFAVR